MKIEIKSIWGSVLFSNDAETLRDAVVAAVKSEADLSEADLYGADLSRANLYEADLSRANLYEADLSRADLSRANLSRANLSRANLSGADLSRADLYGANLSGANLSGANLYGADLYGADLYGATGINKHRTTPLRLLLEQPGAIRAYKLVKSDGRGPFYDGTPYEVGKTYSVKNANEDESVHCAAGINLATLDWCLREYVSGYRILIAEFTAADIATIPTATDGKFRVHRCTIVGEKNVEDLLAGK